MFEPQHMKNCGVQVIDGMRVDGGAITEVIRGANHLTALNTASSQPDGKAVWTVIPARNRLGDREPPKL